MRSLEYSRGHSPWPMPKAVGSDWHAHNELLQQFYTYAVVGIFLMAAFYANLYRQARRMSGSPQRALLLGLLPFIVIRGFADTDRFALTLPLWCITLLTSMLVAPQVAVATRALRQPYPDYSHRLLSFESGAPTKDGQI
jgi:O-antigen ligase